MSRVRFLWALLALIVSTSACAHGSSATSPPAEAYPTAARFTADDGGDVVLHVRIARTDAEKAHGLMHVRSLPTDAGMAFVWDRPTRSSFWMKDTLVPLSIAFVDASGRVVTVREMRPCSAEPCPLYSSDRPFVVAVEANAGWFDRHGVGIGTRLSLEDAS